MRKASRELIYQAEMAEIKASHHKKLGALLLRRYQGIDSPFVYQIKRGVVSIIYVIKKDSKKTIHLVNMSISDALNEIEKAIDGKKAG